MNEKSISPKQARINRLKEYLKTLKSGSQTPLSLKLIPPLENRIKILESDH